MLSLRMDKSFNFDYIYLPLKMLFYPKIIKLNDIITLKTRPGVYHTKVTIQHDNKKMVEYL